MTARVRKQFGFPGGESLVVYPALGGVTVHVRGLPLASAAECRRLAAWFVRVAEWIDARDGAARR